MESVTGIKKIPDTKQNKADMSIATETHSMAIRPVSSSPAISKLTLRLLAINIVALAIVAGGILYLAQYQRGLMTERLDALQTEAEAFAAALGESAVPRDPTLPQQIDSKRSQQVLRRLVPPIKLRARLFDPNGQLIADTRLLAVGGAEVRLKELPSPVMISAIEQWLSQLSRWMDRGVRANLQRYIEYPDQTANHYLEVANALSGDNAASVQRLEDGGAILLAAAPVQRFKRVVGALLLTADTTGIDARVQSVRVQILLLSALAFLITALLSIYLARSVARPIRWLAASADRVARDLGRAQEIPNLSARRDEIGELSVALRRMTETLWERIDAVEGFAADVAHELKNPLSSLRSAAETLQSVDDTHNRDRLFKVLNDDIRRMDRLITDISAASRLDAELARGLTEPVQLQNMLSTMVEIYSTRTDLREVRLELISELRRPVFVQGIESQLAQAFRNLLDNAISFSPDGGKVSISLDHGDEFAEILVLDEGPGLPPGSIDSVFKRFYSERPADEKFGDHSGLGLSIARQILEAHGGSVVASNRASGNNEKTTVSGACFAVRIPLAAE